MRPFAPRALRTNAGGLLEHNRFSSAPVGRTKNTFTQNITSCQETLSQLSDSDSDDDHCNSRRGCLSRPNELFLHELAYPTLTPEEVISQHPDLAITGRSRNQLVLQALRRQSSINAQDTCTSLSSTQSLLSHEWANGQEKHSLNVSSARQINARCCVCQTIVKRSVISTKSLNVEESEFEQDSLQHMKLAVVVCGKDPLVPYDSIMEYVKPYARSLLLNLVLI